MRQTATKLSRTTSSASEGDLTIRSARFRTWTAYLKDEPATSAEQCKAAATAASASDRLTVTESKVINATYQGKPLKTALGKEDFCAEYAMPAEEYNRCAKKCADP